MSARDWFVGVLVPLAIALIPHAYERADRRVRCTLCNQSAPRVSRDVLVSAGWVARQPLLILCPTCAAQAATHEQGDSSG
jgi:hypothetical protein